MAANTSTGANPTGELIVGFAQKSGLAKTQARQFYREFFVYVRDSLLKENYLKIKGLGAFKLMAVGERESIDVTTGDRIEISAHYRVVFTPDKSLANRVNRPFGHFDTIVLDEDVPEESQVQQSSVADTPAVTQKATSPEEKTSGKNDGEELVRSVYLGQDQEEQPSVTQPVTSLNEAEAEAAPVPAEDEQTALTEEAPSQQSQEDDRDASLTEGPEDDEEEEVTEDTVHPVIWWKWLAGMAATVLLLTTGYMVGYYRMLGPTDWLGWEMQDTIVRQTPVKSLVVSEQSIVEPTDSVRHTADTLQSHEPDWKKEALNYPQLEGGEYLIAGTLEEHEMKPGDGIIRLCLKIYGSKEMARYVIFYNQFSNPDNIPVGYKVKFPRLVPRN